MKQVFVSFMVEIKIWPSREQSKLTSKPMTNHHTALSFFLSLSIPLSLSIYLSLALSLFGIITYLCI